MVPSFVGNDYFCDTGNENSVQYIFYGDSKNEWHNYLKPSTDEGQANEDNYKVCLDELTHM